MLTQKLTCLTCVLGRDQQVSSAPTFLCQGVPPCDLEPAGLSSCLPWLTLLRFTQLSPGLAGAQLSLETQMLDTLRDPYTTQAIRGTQAQLLQATRHQTCRSSRVGEGAGQSRPSIAFQNKLDSVWNDHKATPGHVRHCSLKLPVGSLTLPTLN